MKKEVLLVFFIFIVLTGLVFLQAEIEDESAKVNDAYACLQDKVSGNCDTLSLEEKIFAFWASGKCQSELLSESDDNECWPEDDCKIKATAQAVLALDNYATAITAKNWLSSQNTTATDILWYLEIESSEPTTCTISYYGGAPYDINIAEDKTINTNAGPCLALAQDDYWLEVSPSCFDQEFQISCNKKFLTTLLFKKAGSSTIHVSSVSSSASADGLTDEKVNSLCFAENHQCVYEGSLWAALALSSLNEDVSPYIPYLMTLTEDNQRLLQDSFLYFITGDMQYRTSLLSKQKSDSWWLESGEEYFDTALALYPFQTEDITEKTNAKEWLLEVQETSGCWDNNDVRNTAFILASIWPKASGGGGGLADCTTSGYFCMPSGVCEGGILSEYNCPGAYSCCSTPQTQSTCLEQLGEKCSSNQVCEGTTISAGDLSAGQICCIGECGPARQLSDCEINQGTCQVSKCGSSQKEVSYTCQTSSDFCCIAKTRSGGGFWIWFFLILIVLVVIGIIFRDKLRGFRFSKGSGRKRPGPRPGPPHYQRPMPRQHIPERRILLPAPASRRPPRRRVQSKTEKELDAVLGKLKKMGK